MQLVGKSKVTRLNAKTGITYPLIRLPKKFADEIGRTAEMYEVEENSSRALLITFPKSSESKEVIQPKPEVIQLHSQKDVEERLLELELQFKEIKEAIFLYGDEAQTKIKKEAPESGFEPESEPRQGLTGTSRPLATHPSGCVSP